MIFQEPVVEFVKLESTDITANTGAGYTVCQRLVGGDVGCANYLAGSNITASELCSTSWCQDDSEAPSYVEFNA